MQEFQIPFLALETKRGKNTKHLAFRTFFYEKWVFSSFLNELHSLKLTSHLIMDDWKTIRFPFGKKSACSQGLYSLLVLGSGARRNSTSYLLLRPFIGAHLVFHHCWPW